MQILLGAGSELHADAARPLQRRLRLVLDRAEPAASERVGQESGTGPARARPARNHADHPQSGRIHGTLRKGSPALRPPAARPTSHPVPGLRQSPALQGGRISRIANLSSNIHSMLSFE